MIMRYPAFKAFRLEGNDFIDNARMGKEKFNSETGIATAQYTQDIAQYFSEGLELEDPSCEPNYADLLVLGNTPENAPDEDEYVTMTFEEGVPKTINGEAMKVSDIIRKLN